MGQLGLAWSSVAARSQAEGCDDGKEVSTLPPGQKTYFEAWKKLWDDG